MTRIRTIRWTSVCALFVAMVGAAPGVAQGAPGAATPPTASAKQLNREASMTVLPIALAGQPMEKIGEVVGMMLERGGMSNLELTSVAFRPPEGADMAATAKAFADYVKGAPPATEYVLYGEFRGSRERGMEEVRSFIASKAGEIVWQDSQTAKDEEFARIAPKEPLDCCVLLAKRLQPLFGLSDPLREDGPPGRLAKRWEKNTGVPDKAELTAIEARQKAFAKAAPSATLLVYGPRAGQGIETSTADLARLITEAKLRQAIAAATTPTLEVASDMNEQKVLWSMAHAFSEFVKKNPPKEDYVLFADYLMGKNPAGKIGVGGVHFAICNRAGDLVLVDFQNSHHADFQAINPTSREDCDRLVVRRLATYCK